MFRGCKLGNLRVKNHLSQGAEARVWLVEDNRGKKFAVKDYNLPDSRHMKTELRAHKRIGSHPNVAAPIDSAMKKGVYYGSRGDYYDMKHSNALVYKYFACGDLYDYYKLYREGEEYSEHDLNNIMTGMWSGLAHCHKNNLCHRDIKPQNLLYDSDRGTIMITDFGLSSNGQGIVHAGTSLYYSAPECYGRTRHPPYDYRCDVWSAAAVKLTLLWGENVLSNNHGFNVRMMGCKFLKKTYGNKWDDLSNINKAILSASLVPDPRDRCDASDIVNLLA
jgi:serine/threonine protein kinase